MARQTIHRDVDLSNPTAKRELLTEIGRLVGLNDVHVKPVRMTRSTQANRYLFGVVYRAFIEFMREQGQAITSDDAHEYCKARFLPARELFNPNTGELLGTIPARTSTLDSAEFADYIDRVSFWLEDTFGIVLPEPDHAHAAEGRRQTRQTEPAL